MALTREQLFRAIGLVARTPIEAVIDDAYSEVERRRWEQHTNMLDPVDKEHPWFTGFHASTSPMLNSKACGRYALYEMMAIPSPEPTSLELVTTGDAGKDAERQIVQRLHEVGLLLSPPPHEPQLLFEDSDVWLSGSCDAVILPPSSRRPVPVEFKGKDHNVVVELIEGSRQPEPTHVSQLATYIAMAAVLQDQLWPELEPIDGGYLVYFSRQRPRLRKGFFVALDLPAYAAAREVLVLWRQHFEEGTLPDRDPSWYWTAQPCKWCRVKKLCKADLKAGITQMEDSTAIALAKAVMPKYDLGEVRRVVLTRWGLLETSEPKGAEA